MSAIEKISTFIPDVKSFSLFMLYCIALAETNRWFTLWQRGMRGSIQLIGPMLALLNWGGTIFSLIYVISIGFQYGIMPAVVLFVSFFLVQFLVALLGTSACVYIFCSILITRGFNFAGFGILIGLVSNVVRFALYKYISGIIEFSKFTLYVIGSLSVIPIGIYLRFL